MHDTTSNRKIISDAILRIDGKITHDHTYYSESAKVFFLDRYEKILKLFPRLKPDSVGLEVGLAGGVIAIALTRKFKLKKLFALEHPISMKEYSQEFLKIIKAEHIDLAANNLQEHKLPYKSESLDFILFSEVMEHLVPADLPGIMRDFNRVLKKNGLLIVTTPNVASLLKRINLLRGKNPVEFDLNIHENATYGHMREYTMHEVETILQQAKFTVVQKKYFCIDVQRNIFTRIENTAMQLMNALGNNLFVVARKHYDRS